VADRSSWWLDSGNRQDFAANLHGTGECRYVPPDAGESQRRLTRWIVAAAFLLASGWVGLHLGRSRKRVRRGP
jgi:hypothetical protein